MKYVVGMAPNLKEVSTILVSKGHRQIAHRPRWQGFEKKDSEQEPELGSLQVLDLDGSFGRPLG